MDRNTTIGDGVLVADKIMRRFLAVFLAAFCALVIAVVIVAAEGHDIREHVSFVLGFAVLGILIWRYAQRDNYRAEREGDKTLIVTTLLEDAGLTAFIIYVGGLGVGLFSTLPAAVVHAGGAAGVVGYYIGRRLWTNALALGTDAEVL